jgi:phosphocarrier protein
VNGRSILELMTLAASLGTELELSASGDDASALIEALCELISAGFTEND